MVARILLLAADLGISALVKRLIAQHCQSAINVSCASDIAEALACLRSQTVDFIIVEFGTQPEHALALLERLQTGAAGQPIVAIVDDPDSVLATMLRQAGACEVIPKRRMGQDFRSTRLEQVLSQMAVKEASFLHRALSDLVFNSGLEGMLSIDADGMVVSMNPAAERLTGWACREAVGRPVPEVMTLINAITRLPEMHPLDLLMSMGETVRFPVDYILIMRDGGEITIEDSAARILNARGAIAGAVTLFRDASASGNVAVRLDHLAKHDALTDLPNRLFLSDRIDQALHLSKRHGTTAALLFLDLDNFKHVNDSLGHSVGDLLLKSVAQRLLSCTRKSDTVCRQGGDEFVILLPENADRHTASIIAEKMLQAVAAPHLILGQELYVSASIGISVGPPDGDDQVALLRSADIAMYHAKGSGKNSYRFFKQAMNDLAVERQLIESNLRHSVVRRQLVLYYQPKVNLRSGKIIGAEALVRWQHPEWGMVMPTRFIEVAEDFGLIQSIGSWVLHEACQQMRRWLDDGHTLSSVAVNVSPLQFRASGFADELRMVLASAGLDPAYLQLEVTENVFMRDADSAVAMLSEVKEVGVSLAIDDFGTGYSSLSYMHRFPIDVLKIDRSFIHDIGAKNGNSVLVAAVVAIGNSLGQRVVAEGIERQAQVNFLIERDCEEGQGFFYGHPMPADQFAALMSAERDATLP